ncbi:uncharacterized protein LOC143349769 [Colletes latitarsis]|uniref:uncharacterized protein LOC143349769 n=1 Tax=Colletes latitarsis TaxID=2605962 RepID=UPI004035CDB8
MESNTSVGTAIMSREVPRRVLLFSLALLLSAFCKYQDSLAEASSAPDDCSKLDIDELEDYLSNLENATIDTTIPESECPATALPFGALKSDWARLLLLKRAQPQNSILQEKLDRLFKILAIAYSQTDGHFDIAKSVCRTASSTVVPSAYGSDNSEKKSEKLGEPTTDSRKMHEIPESSVSTVALGIEESTDATEIERAAFTSPYVTGEESKREASGRMHNDGSSTVPSSPVGNSSERIDAEEKRIESFVTVPTNVTGETDNYLENNKSNGGPLSANFVTSDFIQDRNIYNNTEYFTPDISGTILLGDVHTTTAMLENNLQETQGTGDSFENAVDSFGRDKGTTGNFLEKESSIKEITEGFTRYIHSTEYFTSGFTTSVDRQVSTKREDRRNTVNSDEETKYGDDTGPSFSEFAKLSSPEMPNDKSTTERSRVYTDGISGNDVVGSIKSFPREPPNRREHGIFRVFQKTPNSTDHRIKIRKPSISKKPPADNGFWKYIVILERSGRGSGKSKKRGSTNANAQKIFRWFYNVGQEDENERSSERHGIRIECNGDRLEDAA